MLLWLIPAVIGAYLFYIIYNQRNHFKKKNVPHLKPWPIFGNIGKFILRQQSMADWILEMYNSSDTRYIGFHSFTVPALLIKDPELIKKICVKNFDHFVDHQKFISDDVDDFFSKNLFNLKGQKWRQMRATLSPAFTGSKMRSMFILMTESAEQFVNYFLKEIGPNEIRTLEMKDTFTRFANDVIASTAFGIKCDSLKEKENAFYLRGKDATNFKGLRSLKFFGYGISPMLMKLFKIKLFSDETQNFFRSLVRDNIAMREKEGIIRPDLIHLLMEARKGKLKHEETADHGAGFATVEESQIGKVTSNDDIVLDDDMITSQALLFFFAGFDSISSVMCHMANELALNEDAQQKLQKEIDETMEACKGKPTYETIIRMKYLDMVLSETLRKWPAAPGTDRECVENFTIEPENPNEVPIEIKKGDVLSIPIYAFHRDPKYYPNPDKFDPERFSDENKGNINLATYMPFGVGPRNCIGSRFALLEAKIIFFYLLSKFSLVVVEKTEIPLQISFTEFNMNAQNGFWLGLKHRSIS